MSQSLTIVLLSLLCGALFAGLLLLLAPQGRRPKGMKISATAAIEELKAIGVLSVFKAVTKEIVTARDHSLGDLGKRYLEWLITSKKMAMIFEFDIDFQYDLRDPSFTVQEDGPGRYRLQMPRCDYVVHVRNVTFYDEQGGKLLPIILPDVINKILGGGFNEVDRNKLMEEAKGAGRAARAEPGPPPQLRGADLRPPDHGDARQELRRPVRPRGVPRRGAPQGRRSSKAAAAPAGG